MKDKGNKSGEILSSFVREILKSINVTPDRLVTLLTHQLEKVDLSNGKKVERTKVRSRVGSKMESFNNDTTTFKNFLDFLKALRVPAVTIRITLLPNKPNKPIVIERTLRFTNVPMISKYERTSEIKEKGGEKDEVVSKDKK